MAATFKPTYGKVSPMAQREVIVMIDDLDYTESDDVSTVEFGYDGRTYEIDLTPENQATLAELIQPYVDAGRQTGGKRKWSRRTRQNGEGGDASRAAG